MSSEILTILEREQFEIYFQPIIKTDPNKIIGYEALLRGSEDSPIKSAIELLQTADQFGLGYELRKKAAIKSIKCFSRLKLTGNLYLNVSPLDFINSAEELEGYVSLLTAEKISPTKVVIEMTEMERVADISALQFTIDQARNFGFTIAIDDVGAAYSGLTLWAQIKPDIVKLDRHFVSLVDQDAVKQAIVTTIVELARKLNCKLIAEGIERLEELTFLSNLGVTRFQGYLFARPNPNPVSCPIDWAGISPAINEDAQKGNQIQNLAQHIPTTTAYQTLAVVEQLFIANPNFDVLAILENNRPLGLLNKGKLERLFGQRYGRELFENKTVGSVLDSDIIFLPHNITIEDAAKRLGGISNQKRLSQHFIVTDGGDYKGIVYTSDLLNALTEIQLNQAIYSNPLTRLPGQVPLNRAVTANKEVVALLYLDLDNFKQFNDRYGYRHGDDAILLLSRILIGQVSDNKVLVFHIGGDDFAVLHFGTEYLAWAKTVKNEYESNVLSLYEQEDLETNTDPKMTVSIGIVPPSLMTSDEYLLAQRSAIAKKLAKQSHEIVELSPH